MLRLLLLVVTSHLLLTSAAYIKIESGLCTDHTGYSPVTTEEDCTEAFNQFKESMGLVGLVQELNQKRQDDESSGCVVVTGQNPNKDFARFNPDANSIAGSIQFCKATGDYIMIEGGTSCEEYPGYSVITNEDNCHAALGLFANDLDLSPVFTDQNNSEFEVLNEIQQNGAAPGCSLRETGNGYDYPRFNPKLEQTLGNCKEACGCDCDFTQFCKHDAVNDDI